MPEPDAKRATMQRIAERAGVSRTTVSFVLNNTPDVNIPAKTRQRILAAARELNYVPDFAARSLATGRTNTVAYIVRTPPAKLSVDSLFLGGVLSGISAAVNAYGFHLLFYGIASDAAPNLYTSLLRSQRVDGLLVSWPAANDVELRDLAEQGAPVVVHGSTTCDDLPTVDIDNAASARAAVEHLINLGHRRIAHVTNGPLDHPAVAMRAKGYRDALEAAGLPVIEQLLQLGNFTGRSGVEAASALLDQGKPFTAIFVSGDVVALGVIKALRQRGVRVPHDVSVVGFDDIPMVSYLEPGLTTIHLPAQELGFHAGDMLVQIISGEEVSNPHVLLETELVVRESTAPPPTA